MSKQKQILGWREWIGLPPLQVGSIKAKVDTGARTSSLHVADLKVFRLEGIPFVRFTIHPVQKKPFPKIEAHAELHDIRYVKSSTGRQTLRPVIKTDIEIAGHRYAIELNLVNRDLMGFRMLLGRTAIRNKFLIDPGNSYIS